MTNEEKYIAAWLAALGIAVAIVVAAIWVFKPWIG